MSETTFINPYNFVPLSRATVVRSDTIPTVEKFRGYSGRLTVKLKALTRLFIPDRRFVSHDPVMIPRRDREPEEGKHPHYKKFLENETGEKIIHGSSLKGMLRSVAETLSNSCFALDTGLYEKGRVNYTNEFGVHHHRRCTLLPDGTGLCICCRIFGYVPAETQEGETAKALKGRVTFYDAVLQVPPAGKVYIEQKAEGYMLKVLSSPKPRHRAFYLAHNMIRGRKFYYHYPAEPHDFIATTKTHLNCTIHECISPQAEFKFRIHFENLAADELGLLLYSILLNGKQEGEDGFMAHKIGMAKPLGFGSVHLSIEEFSIFENDAAYLDFSELKKTEKTLQELLDGYQPDPFFDCDNTCDYDVWKFPHTQNPDEVHYPELAWFSANPDLQLPDDGRLPALDSNDSAKESSASRRQSSSRLQKTAGTTYTMGDKLQEVRMVPQTPQPSQPATTELVVEVIKKKKPHFVIVEIAGVPQQIQCTDGLVDKGTKIVVKKQKDGTYKFTRRS